MTDSLDSLPDAKLSEVFALDVAGWKKVEDCGWSDSDDEMIWDYAEDELASPVFAKSADAVLPYIDAMGLAEVNQWLANFGEPIPVKKWHVRVLVRGQFVEGEATTFTRAACIALIRAKRAQKGTP